MKKFLFTAALCAISASAYADEIVKVRLTTHIVASQGLDVGDVDGHTLSVARGTGLASYPDGSVGTTSFVSMTDYVKGSGDARVYYNITAPDGSQIWTKSTGGSATVVGNKTEFKGGTSVILGGTGKLAGAKGDATWSGERLQAQLATGAELYLDMVINIKK